jgi:hypothetical protein
MLERLRRRLTYANLVATLALFVALGGSSYAVTKISGSQIENRTISGKKLKRNTLGGRQVQEARLGTVPRARNADQLNGVDVGQLVDRLVLRCPDGTYAAADVCVETQARPPATYDTAVLQCGGTDGPPGGGRRLPTHSELRMAATSDLVQIAPGGELTGVVYASRTIPGQVEVLSMTNEVGNVALLPDGPGGERGFRCVADPRN